MTQPPSPEMVKLAAQCWKDIVSGAKDELVSGDLRYARTPREECEQIIARALAAAHAQGRAEVWEEAAQISEAPVQVGTGVNTREIWMNEKGNDLAILFRRRAAEEARRG